MNDEQARVVIHELEEQFFKTFGIEPEYYCTYEMIVENNLQYECTDNNLEKCKECKEVGKRYPEISAEKFLEMICICNSTYINGYTNYFISTGKTKEKLKEEILKKCITLSKDIQDKIQQLFKN